MAVPNRTGDERPRRPFDIAVRIALIGSFRAQPDEGMRKLCGQFEMAVRRHHEVMTVQTSDFCRGTAWTALRAFRPRCLHYLTGPTIASLIALKFHRLTLPRPVATVATGIRPFLGTLSRAILPWLAPDIFLAQSRRWARLFEAAGSRTRDFPNGVDTSRFAPVPPDARRALKLKWGMTLDKPVVLHVGHIKENRNLDSLIDVHRSGRYEVWVIGSESESRRGPWHRRLEDAGCRLHTRFMPAIEEAYQAADFYVFTVKALSDNEFPRHQDQIGVIDFPLSILEAMACGLPVLSTAHDAVSHFCGAVPGLRFFDGTGADCLRQLDALRGEPVSTRTAAQRFDLNCILDQLRGLYRELEEGRTLA